MIFTNRSHWGRMLTVYFTSMVCPHHQPSDELSETKLEVTQYNTGQK